MYFAHVSWTLTGFYGHLETNNREESWAFLESLSRSAHLPWLCVGNFNERMSQDEKAGGCLRMAWQMDCFRQTIHLCNFIDLGYVDSLYTWPRNHPTEGHTHIRLDRVLATIAWKSLFPGSTGHHISMSSSDHSLIAIHLHRSKPQSLGSQPLFHFEVMWLQDPRCAEVV